MYKTFYSSLIWSKNLLIFNFLHFLKNTFFNFYDSKYLDQLSSNSLLTIKVVILQTIFFLIYTLLS